jgi:Uri superfamily endonuclease
MLRSQGAGDSKNFLRFQRLSLIGLPNISSLEKQNLSLKKMAPDGLTPGPGTYILILQLENDQIIQVGKLGLFRFPAGYYAYVGSAFGPGGLAGRLTHHLHPGKKLHWHIDYFRKNAVLVEILVREDNRSLEHKWASDLGQLDGAVVPVPRFGSSDCKCLTHLYYFQERPVLEAFQLGFHSH